MTNRGPFVVVENSCRVRHIGKGQRLACVVWSRGWRGRRGDSTVDAWSQRAFILSLYQERSSLHAIAYTRKNDEVASGGHLMHVDSFMVDGIHSGWLAFHRGLCSFVQTWSKANRGLCSFVQTWTRCRSHPCTYVLVCVLINQIEEFDPFRRWGCGGWCTIAHGQLAALNQEARVKALEKQKSTMISIVF
jgi:hypothetical protein